MFGVYLEPLEAFTSKDCRLHCSFLAVSTPSEGGYRAVELFERSLYLVFVVMI